jgi:predicted dehydrogenase
MAQPLNRRQFFKRTAAVGALVAGAGYHTSTQAAESKSVNESIAFACVGFGGKGKEDFADAGKHGDLIAICDIDDKQLDNASKKFPEAARFTDYRRMLDRLHKSIDAVVISTPDHTHAVIAAASMWLGKHAFVQKPLTHCIWEARELGRLARQMKVATQMGNQHTAADELRRGAALVQAGVLGPVKEVHVWTNRPIWPQGDERPPAEEAPTNIHWDEFIGPAAYRPYAKGYHPFNWRGWWDFGTGALGDMACHTMNLPFMALSLRDPTSVEAESSGHNRDSYPKWSIIKFQFPATDKRPALQLTWYDGGKTINPDLVPRQWWGVEKKRRSSEAPKEASKDTVSVDANTASSDAKVEKKPEPKPEDTPEAPRKLQASGCLIIGEKGLMFAPDDYAREIKLSDGVSEPKVEYKKSPGHFLEWVQAIKGGEQPMSNFPDYAGPLTETVLLGNLAVWAGKKVEWDGRNMVAKNAPEVEPIIKNVYHNGYSL